ncbi:MAG TPA: cytochrome c [Steroidobacteraceae bacterium]|nr:cytochrome c [Steroidobacteraceae bacterium]
MNCIFNRSARVAVIGGLTFAASVVFAGDAPQAPAAGAAPKSAATSGAARPLALPISLVDLMRASIEIPADGLWAAAGADKLSEEDWQLADQDAVNLIAATAQLASPGTGKNDRKWVSHADWQSWVREMEKTALTIRAAVKAGDQKTLAAVADHLQQICEACHTKYRPQTPSDGVTRYPFYPKRDLAK